LRAGNNLVGPDPNVDSIFNGLLIPTNAQGQSDNSGYAALQNAPAFIDQNAATYRRNRARVTGNGPTADNGAFQFGNVPRVTGEVRNFKYYNEDFSLLKKTPIGETVNLTLKVELLNAFNRHIFQTPNTNPGDRFFGVPTSTIDQPRAMQLTARIQF